MSDSLWNPVAMVSEAIELKLKSMTEDEIINTFKQLTRKKLFSEFEQMFLALEIDTAGRLTKNEDFLDVFLKFKLVQGRWLDVIELLKSEVIFSSPVFLEYWDEANYLKYQEDNHLEPDSLTPLMKYRIRNRNPPPDSICPDGRRPTRMFPMDSVTIMKQWFCDHRDHPYPCNMDKERLAKKAGLTVMQVSQWFENSRRKYFKKLKQGHPENCCEWMFGSYFSLLWTKKSETATKPSSASKNVIASVIPPRTRKNVIASATPSKTTKSVIAKKDKIKVVKRRVPRTKCKQNRKRKTCDASTQLDPITLAEPLKEKQKVDKATETMPWTQNEYVDTTEENVDLNTDNSDKYWDSTSSISTNEGLQYQKSVQDSELIAMETGPTNSIPAINSITGNYNLLDYVLATEPTEDEQHFRHLLDACNSNQNPYDDSNMHVQPICPYTGINSRANFNQAPPYSIIDHDINTTESTFVQDNDRISSSARQAQDKCITSNCMPLHTKPILAHNWTSMDHYQTPDLPTLYSGQKNENNFGGSNHSETLNANHTQTFSANHSHTLSAKHSKTLSGNHSQTLSANYSQILSANYYQTLNANHSQTLSANYSQTLSDDNSQTLSAYHSETLSANHSQTFRANHSQTLSADNSQTLSANHSETLSANHSQALSANHSQTLSDSHYQTLSDSHSQTQTLSANPSQTLSTNHFQNLSANHSQTLRADNSQTLSANHSETLSASHSQALSASHSQTQTLSAHHSQKLSANHTQTLSANHSQTLRANHSHTLSAYYSQTLSANNPQTLSARPSQTLSANNSQTLSANHTQTLCARQSPTFSANHSQALSDIYSHNLSAYHSQNQTLSTNNSQTLSANYSKSLIANHTQTLSANHSKSLIANHTQTLSTNHSKSLIANHTQTLSANHSKSLIANHTQTLSANHSKSLSANHPQTLSANHSKSLIANHTQKLSANYSKSLIANHTQKLSANHSKPLIANHTQTFSANHSNSLSANQLHTLGVHGKSRSERILDCIYNSLITNQCYKSECKYESKTRHGLKYACCMNTRPDYCGKIAASLPNDYDIISEMKCLETCRKHRQMVQSAPYSVHHRHARSSVPCCCTQPRRLTVSQALRDWFNARTKLHASKSESSSNQDVPLDLRKEKGEELQPINMQITHEIDQNQPMREELTPDPGPISSEPVNGDSIESVTSELESTYGGVLAEAIQGLLYMSSSQESEY